MNINITKHNVDELLIQAIKEDITNEDITTNAIVKNKVNGDVQLICKEDGILSGIDIFERVFLLMDENTFVKKYKKDGDKIKKGEVIAKIEGDVRVLLSAERTALNYLQRMSGIATYTNKMVSTLDDKNTKLLDSRKTTPNMRIFEKYSVVVGGGVNHRYNLSDGILIKDNHINAAGGVEKAVNLAKQYCPFVRKIEVETENIEMVKEALKAKADIIMLDNMSVEIIKEAIKIINKKATVECSGNIDIKNIKNYKNLGIDYISSGSLTHSAKVLDFSMKNLQISDNKC